MRKTTIASLAFAATLGTVLATSALPCCSLTSAAYAAEVRTATLRVEGMTCGGCATSVKIVLKKLEGVKEAKVSYEEKRATVQYDPGKITPQQMARAIEEKLGYNASVVEGN